MLEIATVIMVITFGMALYYMIKDYTSKESSEEELSVNDEEVVIKEVNNEEITFEIDTESDGDLELLANTIEEVIEEIVEETKPIKEFSVKNGSIEKLGNTNKKLPKIINEVMEITNSVEPEVEYTSEDYRIIDTSLSYKIEGNSDRELMNHIIKGVFTTSEGAGVDYNTMNVHLVIINKTTNEEVINVIQSYYNVTSPNSKYHFGFNEVTDYNEDDYTFKCSITGYYDNKTHTNNISLKANLRK